MLQKCLRLRVLQLSGNMSQVSGVISFRIVTARNFFVLHNNHPFNHTVGAKHCSSAERKRDTLFFPKAAAKGSFKKKRRH